MKRAPEGSCGAFTPVRRDPPAGYRPHRIANR